MNIEKIWNKKNRSIEFSNAIIWGIFFLLVLKTILFILVGTSKTGYGVAAFFPIINLLPAQLACILILIFLTYLFKEKKQCIYLIIIDILYSGFLILNLWYFRASGEYLGIRYLLYEGLFNPMNRSLINIGKGDILYILDIPILLIILIKTKAFLNKKRNLKVATFGILLSMITVYGSYYEFDIKKIDNGRTIFLKDDWGSAVEMRSMWPIAYTIKQDYKAVQAYTKKPDLEEINKVNEWFKENDENLEENEYFGMLKGKNVIFVQMESLEDFVIGEQVYGQEVTPVLNKLIEYSLYFDNVYEQNNGGNSIDCDMMANTGMLTLGDSITFISNPFSQYPSMARTLEGYGYTAISTRAEPGGDYNFAEAHKNALGFKNIWDGNEYELDEIVGFGLSDKSFYNQYIDKLKTVKEPFFSMIPNLSNHGPFDIKEDYRELDLPKDLDETKLGGYFQSSYYADKQIGFLINKLEQLELMKDTVLVIYGDHGGVHKYYQDELADIKLEGDWWKEYERKIPLIIYSEGLKGKTINTIGGHMDIMPTVLNLLGAKEEAPIMGRNLLNTKVNATVIKGGTIIGDPSDKERKHLKEAYEVAEYIINNDYYNYENKVKK
ncbi:MAG: LTA synthase family protein [Clostridium sp.]|uniref:LTA synthase family protein n=1 Tax=Clostridium sp. TaxID=1506 RepID=UPI003EE7A484